MKHSNSNSKPLLIITFLLLYITTVSLAEQNCFEKTPQTSNDATVNPSEYDSNHINYYFLKKGYY
ncbi:MAG: hypothetical protein HQL46_15555 [Gammaproteobacteria bacterium]|nr:hypothetical protein [Gammaproteobacteria bacterium]